MPVIPSPAGGSLSPSASSFDLPTLHIGSTVALDREARVMRCAPNLRSPLFSWHLLTSSSEISVSLHHPPVCVIYLFGLPIPSRSFSKHVIIHHPDMMHHCKYDWWVVHAMNLMAKNLPLASGG